MNRPSPHFAQLLTLQDMPAPAEPEDDGEPICSNPRGHEWSRPETEQERCLCVHCGADGDA